MVLWGTAVTLITSALGCWLAWCLARGPVSAERCPWNWTGYTSPARGSVRKPLLPPEPLPPPPLVMGVWRDAGRGPS